ncbi:sarcosine oxidase subunit gamma [Marinobacterium zhoushanense]|uniref:Sarcosine oxidase subunit gamma n=1 Tax=Marinobacterium zhoushanense TaxID=1679163 RepID=A0ABQ1KHI4_9GAMM|nr:sarcosine oxidase subunit gamma family protein [Marinobacterium zhoushanense]GGB96484.1 sarcosine oxidase subunit gamma [Marinobacterium zhoushanense]
MSETLAPEKEGTVNVAVMNQVAGSGARAESPLHHAELDKLAARNPRTGGVMLRELKLLGHLTLRGSQQNESFMNGCAEVLGLALPTQPLTSVEKGSVSIRWISPDEWLVVLPADQAYEVEQGLRAAIEGHFSVVNVSGGQTLLELSGPNARDVLKKSCPLDVHPSQFPVGKVAGTVFAKSTAVVRRSGEESWELVVRRSFADYIWLWLQDASREYGLVIKS